MAFSWEEARAELARRRERALQHGSAPAIERQKAQGRQLVRERIAQLTDPGSFTEIGTLAVVKDTNPDGSQGDSMPTGHIMGLARIDGRLVAVGGDDFTVRGGAGSTTLDQRKGGFGGFVDKLAKEYRIPLIQLIESIGGDVSIQDDLGHAPLVSGISLTTPLSLLAEVPVLCVVMGAAAGAAPSRACISHFSAMVEGQAFAVTAGPPVVRRAMGMQIDKFELGGAQVHTTNGTIDNAAKSEADAFDQLRRVLSYLPQNVWELPPYVPTDDPPDRLCTDLYQIMPENRRRPFNPQRLVGAIVDRDSFFEIGAGWGRACITGFARLGGYAVGVLCNNPAVNGGAIDARTAQKQTRFMDFCDIFHLPIVNLVDVPGVMIGPEAERESAMRFATRAVQAIYQVTVPLISVYLRKAYGLGALATNNPDRLGLRLAWPGTEFGDMPIEGSVEAAYRKEIYASDDPNATRKAIEDRMREGSSTWKTAEAFGLEEMIDPAETRRYLTRFIEASQGALQRDLGIKHRTGLRI